MTNHPNRSSGAYDLAFWGDALIACIPTGGDIEQAVKEEGLRARIDFEAEGGYRVVTGVRLTDNPRDTDDVVYKGHSQGWLSDEKGRTFEYAVKR